MRKEGGTWIFNFQFIFLSSFLPLQSEALSTMTKRVKPPSKPSRVKSSLVSVGILVLGDIGRSPRMQFHAMSLADNGFSVNLIGFAGTEPPEALTQHPQITLKHLPELHKVLPNPMAKVFAKLPFILQAPVKLVFQLLHLLLLFLVVLPRLEFILVQNPPAIPTLMVVQFVCLVTRAKLVIDWHNLAYSILALKYPSSNSLSLSTLQLSQCSLPFL